MKPAFFSPWFIWAGILVLISAVVAYGNIHMGPEASRLSPWNWVWVAVMGGIVVGTRCYQYFWQQKENRRHIGALCVYGGSAIAVTAAALALSPVSALFLLFIALFAISEAWRDAKAIARHEPINHAKGLLFRLAIGSIFFGCASALHWLIAHDFMFLLFAPMGWAAFTMLFRFALNLDLRKDWRYLGPSIRGPKDSWYDGMFFVIALYESEREPWPDRSNPVCFATRYYTKNGRRAGTLAYAFELAVFLASAITFFALR